MSEITYPSSPESEKGVIASFLQDPIRVGALCAEKKITTAHFHVPAHADIYITLMDMWSSSEGIDFITLTQKLRDRSILDQCGGPIFITDLFTYLPTAANIRTYLEAVEEQRILRGIMVVCGAYTDPAKLKEENASTLLAGLGEKVSGIATTTKVETMTFKQALKNKLHRIQFGEPDHQYVPTGITSLDNQSPMRLGEMPLISGERKSGKSILAISIARHVAKNTGPVLYFSLEDPISKVTDRFVAAESAIPMARDSMESLREGDVNRLERAMETLSKTPIIIRDDCYDLSVIMSVSRQCKIQTPELKLIVVDYGQLVRAVVDKGANREQVMATVSRGLRLLSMELKVAIIVLVQLNKEGDTRESKAWEQDCTAMWKLVTLADDDAERNGARFLTVPFQRNGESGIGFKVAFLGHIARIENYAHEQ